MCRSLSFSVLPIPSLRGRGLGDLAQELLVGLGRADLVGEQLQGGGRLERVQHPAKSPHQRELLASTLMAGNSRFSASWRSSRISMLPVPLDSSKIPSSMRDPVSTRALAMMVTLPPS